jgi:hypothetical protein
MKTIKLTVLFICSPIVFFAQTLTGLWIGSVHNDSATIRKDQSFEIVLTQYKDKVYGYSRSTFTVHDSLFYILKRVKGTIEGNVCEVKDDDVVSYNFKGRLDKGVKMVSTFHFDQQDSVWRMDGDWKTNKTKKYYSLSGKIALAQEKDLAKSKIFPHLEELKLANDVAFYDDYKKSEEPVVTNNQPTKADKQAEVAKTTKPSGPSRNETGTSITQAKQTAVKETPVTVKDDSKTLAANNDKKNTNVSSPAKPESVAQTNPPQKNTAAPTIVKEEKITSSPAKETASSSTPEVKRDKNTEAIAQAKPSITVQNDQPSNDSKKPIVKDVAPPVVTISQTEQKKDIVTEQVKPEAKALTTSNTITPTDKSKQVSMFSDAKPAVSSNAAIFVAERKVAPPQVVSFTSDSLELALYDNGEVDGDTVSVLLNGEIILARQGLKASAIKKMIYVPAGKNDSMTLVLYAENLGKYPPNTGLLIVHDGEETYQIRFSADLTQNAAVIFKRKKN